MRLHHLAALAYAVALVLPSCFCGHQTFKRPYAAPSVEQILKVLADRYATAKSFSHSSTMDFLSGGERIKTTVYVMGQAAGDEPIPGTISAIGGSFAGMHGARVRFNALDPAGGTVMADLACDGTDFAFVDFQNDCQLAGPCTADSIGQLLRVRLEPGDFVLLALGQTPLMDGETKGAVGWDEERGAEVVELVAADGRKQRIVLDGRSGKTWDVIESTRWTREGAVEWKLSQKDFSVIEAADGTSLRVGRKLRFEQPSAKADLIVEWDERELNPTLAATKFLIAIPPGLKVCGQKTEMPAAAPATAPSPAAAASTR